MTEDTFHELQEAVRAGRYSALRHFNKRAAERGFTLEQAVEVLAHDGAIAALGSGKYWVVAEPVQPEPAHQLNVRVKLTTRRTVLLITGWLASDQRKSLRRAVPAA